MKLFLKGVYFDIIYSSLTIMILVVVHNYWFLWMLFFIGCSWWQASETSWTLGMCNLLEYFLWELQELQCTRFFILHVLICMNKWHNFCWQQLQSTGKIHAPTDKKPDKATVSRPPSVHQRLSAQYNFEDTDDIAESVKVGSPGKRKSRRKKSRGKSMRTNTDGSEVTETTDGSSPESSRGQNDFYQF